MQQFLVRIVFVQVGFYLYPKGYTLFAAMFLRGEFCADAVDLDIDACIVMRIPYKFSCVQSLGDLNFDKSIR